MRDGGLKCGLCAFWQEARANDAAEKLKAMIHVNRYRCSGSVAREIPLRDLVPGDIVKLAAAI